MAQRKSGPTRPQRKPRRRRFARPERSLAAAGWLGALTVLAVAVLVLFVEMAFPTSVVRGFYDLVFVNGIVSPESDIYKDYLGALQRHDDLFVFPLSLFFGGLAMGRLAPGRATRARVLGTAAGVALAVILASLSVVWVPTFLGSRGHPLGVDTRYVLTLTAAVAYWTASLVLGAFLGLLWRGARRPPDADAPPESRGLETRA